MPVEYFNKEKYFNWPKDLKKENIFFSLTNFLILLEIILFSRSNPER